MNDTKWSVVLGVLSSRRIACRIKLLDQPSVYVTAEHGLRGECKSDPAEAIAPEVVFTPSPSYWETGRLGPFKTQDIEWLAILTAELVAIRDELPKNLQLAERGQDTAIIGYAMQ